MEKYSINFSRVVRLGLMVSTLCLVGTYTSIANASQGCGHGFHRNVHDRCVFNHPGPRATPAPYHRGCWRNAWGRLRCYR